jgi:hypothetical protein
MRVLLGDSQTTEGEMKKGEEVYTITLKGLIGGEAVNTLELYLRRHYSKGGHPCVVLDLETGKFEFATVQKKQSRKGK